MNYKILIVDDIPKNIQLLANILEPEGCDIEFATNGAEAIDWVLNENFDLILLDVMMPDKNGYQVCEEIKSIPAKRDIPVIFLTAKNDLESITKGFDMGGVDYVTKPFNSKELVARITAHAELRRGRQQLQMMNESLEAKVKERTNDLEVARKQLEVLDIAKSQFLRIISHEVRTPLNGIINSVALLKRTAGTENVDILIRILDDSVIRLEKFSFTALQISQLILLKNKVLEFKTLNIKNLVEKCLVKVCEASDEKRLSFQVDVDPNCIFLGDDEFMKACIMEILSNSIMYSPNNYVIRISSNTIDQVLHLTISDQGPGFSELALENLFKPFSPGQEHINDNPGLGLFLAKLVIDSHGGIITGGNNQDGGAFVTIQLPLGKNKDE